MPFYGPKVSVGRADFLVALLDILGDTRLLWLPATGDETTTTDASRNARTVTYDATIAARIAALGSGVSVDFDGTDDEADTPDAADLSFGDGAVDGPFSIVALVNPDTVAGSDEILTKYDLTTGVTKREWQLVLVSGAPRLILYDESAAANIGRGDATALTTATWTLLVGTYDGSAAESGINLYKDGALVDDTAVSSGTYVAMENTASLVRLAFSQGAAAGANFYDGRMGLVALAAKALSIDEVWAVKSLLNGFAGLTL